MTINTDNIVSLTETNQNFSRVARMVDRTGAAVINNPAMNGGVCCFL